jgi:hypothetical protein
MARSENKDLNSILKKLNEASGTFINDEILIAYCNIDKDLYFAYKSKLYKEKYIDGGKGMCTISDNGKLFISNGGYKQENSYDKKSYKIAICSLVVAIIGLLLAVYAQDLRQWLNKLYLLFF